MKKMLRQFIGFADAGEGEHAQVELVSDADDIHQPHLIGLHVHDGDDEANILLDARDALELAAHLTRAANQVYMVAGALIGEPE
jgi:hypothetical protein